MPRTRIDLFALTQWITAAAREHPEDLAAHLAERLAVSRRSAQQRLKRLVEAQWLVGEGTPRRRRYRPGLLRQVARCYPIAGLQEDLPWARDFAPHFEFAPNVARLMQHAFTELLNNAIDHSGGRTVTVSMRQTATHAQLLVSDDGCGVFEQIRERFDIADPALAALELSKGKLTSDPARHTGRGLFFSARMADVFDLQANDRAFQHRSWDGARPLRERPPGRTGTCVFVGIALDTERTLDQVLRSHSSDGTGYSFERTVVPLRLLATPTAGLESRAQARRVAARLSQFRRAEIDFAELEDIGHGFADELFRCFAGSCTDLELVPLNLAPRVAAMLGAVRQVA